MSAAAGTMNVRHRATVDLGAIELALVEIDPSLAALARDNAARNAIAARIVTLDVTASAQTFAAAGLRPDGADHVLMNPPFNDASSHRASPVEGRRLAHMDDGNVLEDWIGAARRVLTPRGTLTLVWRADGLGEVLAALGRGFGAIVVLPVYPRPGAAALRILVRAVKGSAAPLRLLSGLTLQDDNGAPSKDADAILRAGNALLPQ